MKRVIFTKSRSEVLAILSPLFNQEWVHFSQIPEELHDDLFLYLPEDCPTIKDVKLSFPGELFKSWHEKVFADGVCAYTLTFQNENHNLGERFEAPRTEVRTHKTLGV